MLLPRPVRDGARRGRSVRPRVAAEPAAAAVESRHSATAALAIRALPEGELPELIVYLHPGRACLGPMTCERVLGQLELGGEEAYADLAQAESAAKQQEGFLVEVRGPFVDIRGVTRRDGAVFFASGPRR